MRIKWRLRCFLEITKLKTRFDSIQPIFDAMNGFIEITDVMLMHGCDAPQRRVFCPKLSVRHLCLVDTLVQLAQQPFSSS